MGTVEAFEKEKFDIAKAKGLFTQEEKIEFLIKDGLWSLDLQKKLGEIKDEVKNLNITIKKLFLSSQIKKMREIIRKREAELTELESERKELLGVTCEVYSDNKANQEFLRISLYQDEELKSLKFQGETYYDLTNQDLLKLTTTYNFATSDFTPETMKCIAASPFFLNTILICKSNPMIFFGKPIIELTNYQVDLFTNGLRYKNILEQGKSPPETVYTDIQEVVDWYEMALDRDGKHENTKKTKDADGQTIFGANQKELENFTSSDDDKRNTVSLLKESDKIGKKEEGKTRLGFKELLDLHGK
jgi:hypothetical protein